MRILGIETTCDETSCAVVDDGMAIRSNVISSQIALHRPFGGVVPEIACRQHIDTIAPVLQQALEEAHTTLDTIDRIAVAQGPGLIGALLVGIRFAQGLAYARRLPLIGVNHVEAHLYAAMMTKQCDLPALGVVLSGGHTSLVLIHAVGSYALLGSTVDDAIGEAFDKVAKILGLPYPGGPEIEALAREGDPNRYPLHGGVVKGRPLDFSFSGLKTAVLYTVRDLQHPPTEQERRDIAASFQRAAIDDVVHKIHLARERYPTRTLLLGGGVTRNQTLRQKLPGAVFPAPELCLDNAAMLAGLAAHKQPGSALDPLEPQTRMPFSHVVH